MLSSGNIQYFSLFHFIWSTKNVNTCSQCSNMWGLQHLWPLFLETYLVISQNVDPVFPNKAKARKSLIFQLSSRQIISTKLKFHQSDATSWESNSEVSIMGWGWGGGGGQLRPEESSYECGACSSGFLVGDGDRALDSKICCAARKVRC